MPKNWPKGLHVKDPQQNFPPLSPQLANKRFDAMPVNGGMVTMLDPAALETSQQQFLQNAYVRFDRTFKRSGTTILGPTQPDNNLVRQIAFLKLVNGTPFTVRFAIGSINIRTSPSAWTAVTANSSKGGAALNAGPNDFYSVSAIPNASVNLFVFADNGQDELQVLDPVAAQWYPLRASNSVSTRCRYVTGFGTRVVGAAIANVDEVRVIWSGDGNPTVFDQTVDQTAGFQEIATSPTDESDFISGIFGYTNQLVVFKEKSIWLGLPQPSSQQPFYFFAAVSQVGSDSPWSIVPVYGGFAFYDFRTGTVWYYQVGTLPTPIGRPVEATIRSGVTDPKQIFASYNPIQNEYTVFVPQTGSNIVLGWTYNFRTKTWVQQSYSGISCANDTYLQQAGTTIGELQGTIANLGQNSSPPLTIAQLTPQNPIINVRCFGLSNGGIWFEDITASNDGCSVDSNGITNNTTGTPILFQFVSKAFEVPEYNIYVQEIRIEIIASTAPAENDLILYYAKDGGVNANSWILAENYTIQTLGSTVLIRFKYPIWVRRFAFKFTATLGTLQIIRYEVHYSLAGMATQ